MEVASRVSGVSKVSTWDADTSTIEYVHSPIRRVPVEERGKERGGKRVEMAESRGKHTIT
jgi:hypothetical protein